MVVDDLPWPELGNISRGATRGNQGQKGVLGPPDEEGRCLLQLRVQPGVLEVRLTRQASDWYRLLDSEVTRALKLTKTYWRKARRRQDYDARADQDHMELHEWLQQLKDKVMSHLEMLMQKGDIPGPPYIMPDNVELTFLIKFVERQTAGMPHNPRLREAGITQNPPPPQDLGGSESPEPTGDPGPSSIANWDAADKASRLRREADEHQMNHNFLSPPNPSARLSVLSTLSLSSMTDINTLLHEAGMTRQLLQNARGALYHAQQETQEAFSKFSLCRDNEEKARDELARVEEQHDTLMSLIMRQCQSQPPPQGMIATDMSSQRNSAAMNGRLSPSVYHPEAGPSTNHQHQERRPSNRHMPTSAWNDSLIDPHLGPSAQSQSHAIRTDSRSTNSTVGQTMDWTHVEPLRVEQFQSSEARLMEHDLSRSMSSPQIMNSRKHVRAWDHSLQEVAPDNEDGSVLPPRKRMHQLSEGLHMVNNINPPLQDIPMSSQGVLATPPAPHYTPDQPSRLPNPTL